MTSIVWFREDLRVTDNSALSHALNLGAPVVGVYIFDPQAWSRHDTAACRIEFMLRNLASLQVALRERNIPLLLLEVRQSDAVPRVFEALAQPATTLLFNDQYEVNEQRRDAEVARLWRAKGGRVERFTDQVLFGPGEIVTQMGHAFSVFTPYKKAFIRRVIDQALQFQPLASVPAQAAFPSLCAFKNALQHVCRWHEAVPDAWPGYLTPVPAFMWPGGEIEAQRRLSQFIDTKIHAYQQDRDYPALSGTSQLSPYLANGVLSPRQCWHAAVCANPGALSGGGVECWLSELIWREFYKQIVWSYPRVSKHQPFKLATLGIAWRQDLGLFDAWCTGATGFPLIDAAMRQLQQTGWMHNRLRMVVAMFLTKQCFIDWRWGERFFMQHLIDGDLAANNGGWQWSASTGTDAVPYFRIFNPVRQSQRFDPQAEFIRHYCPELANLNDKDIHTPWLLPPMMRAAIDYPPPILDLSTANQQVLAAFKALSL